MRRVLVGVAAVFCAAFACNDAQPKPQSKQETMAKPAQTDNTAEDYVAPKLPLGRVILPDAYGQKQVVEVEVATTPEQTERGLMWRRELPAGKGMLFIFEGEDEHSFWMRNTLIPLDMIFLSTDGTIVGIVENAQPKTLTSRTVGRPSHYVLEVRGGWSAKVGLRSGTKAELQLPPGVAKP